MIIPVRCFSCGKEIASLYKPYLEYMKKGESSEKAFEELGVNRFCCKRMIVSHVDLIDELLEFPRLE
jgi:DNA-directed RNA polymerase subunit N (RpoN/RPB10)